MSIAETVTENVKSFVQSYIPSAKLVQESRQQLSFILPNNVVKKDGFGDFFSHLELNLESLGLKSFGITETPLEVVRSYFHIIVIADVVVSRAISIGELFAYLFTLKSHIVWKVGDKLSRSCVCIVVNKFEISCFNDLAGIIRVNAMFFQEGCKNK